MSQNPAPNPRQPPLQPFDAWTRYQQRVRQPWPALLFLTPLILVYEIGGLWAFTQPGPNKQLVAENLLQALLGWLGITGYGLPGLVVVGVLLAWHWKRHDPWRIAPWIPLLIAAESFLVAFPLLVFHGLILTVGDPLAPSPFATILLCIGAGIFEELVFRLGLIAAFAQLAHSLFPKPHRLVTPVAILLAAVIFALCHFQPVGSEPYNHAALLHRLVSGAYLGVIFVHRGFGVAVGTHITYNLAISFGATP